MRERAAEQLRTNLRESMRADGYSEELIADLEAFVDERGAEMNEKAIREGRVKARRIQLRRTAGWRMPPNTIKVDRSTDHGNPFAIVRLDRHQWAVNAPSGRTVSYHGKKEAATVGAVEAFRKWITSGDIAAQRRRILAVENLRGHNLACWCPEGGPCHADVLIELAAGRLAVSGE